jgi:hypothetical protein
MADAFRVSDDERFRQDIRNDSRNQLDLRKFWGKWDGENQIWIVSPGTALGGWTSEMENSWAAAVPAVKNAIRPIENGKIRRRTEKGIFMGGVP